MTRQDLDRLLRRLYQDSENSEITLMRVRTDSHSGRMVCEWEAPDQEQLTSWLNQRNVRFRGSEEWIMKVQMESQDGKMVAL